MIVIPIRTFKHHISHGYITTPGSTPKDIINKKKELLNTTIKIEYLGCTVRNEAKYTVNCSPFYTQGRIL